MLIKIEEWKKKLSFALVRLSWRNLFSCLSLFLVSVWCLLQQRQTFVKDQTWTNNKNCMNYIKTRNRTELNKKKKICVVSTIWMHNWLLSFRFHRHHHISQKKKNAQHKQIISEESEKKNNWKLKNTKGIE